MLYFLDFTFEDPVNFFLVGHIRFEFFQDVGNFRVV